MTQKLKYCGNIKQLSGLERTEEALFLEEKVLTNMIPEKDSKDCEHKSACGGRASGGLKIFW